MKNKNKYVSNEAGRCPKCGGNRLNYQNPELDLPRYIDYPYICCDCGCEGLEYYALEFDGHSVYNPDIDELEEVNIFLPIGITLPKLKEEKEVPKLNTNRIMTMDIMNHVIYEYDNTIDMLFDLDYILNIRKSLNIPYVLHKYNNGDIIVIRSGK
jgi:hypothetical protein